MHYPKPPARYTSPRIYIEADSRAPVVERILLELRALPVPFVEPVHIAPLAGVSVVRFRHICRHLRRRDFRFWLDDADSLRVLRRALMIALKPRRNRRKQ